MTYRRARNGWPLHKKASSEEERVLGVWLHVQRINHRQGTLTTDRGAKLNAQLQGWRDGRARSGRHRWASSCIVHGR